MTLSTRSRVAIQTKEVTEAGLLKVKLENLGVVVPTIDREGPAT